MWPALFTLAPNVPWPNGGELDILEYVPRYYQLRNSKVKGSVPLWFIYVAGLGLEVSMKSRLVPSGLREDVTLTPRLRPQPARTSQLPCRRNPTPDPLCTHPIRLKKLMLPGPARTPAPAFFLQDTTAEVNMDVSKASAGHLVEVAFLTACLKEEARVVDSRRSKHARTNSAGILPHRRRVQAECGESQQTRAHAGQDPAMCGLSLG